MSCNEWTSTHKDVMVQISLDRIDMGLDILMWDANDKEISAKRHAPLRIIPYEIDPIITDDFISSMLELLYSEIRAKRKAK